MYSTLSTLDTTTEVPLSKALNPKLLPGCGSINAYPLLRVCVHGVCVHCCVFFTLNALKYIKCIPSSKLFGVCKIIFKKLKKINRLYLFNKLIKSCLKLTLLVVPMLLLQNGHNAKTNRAVF